MTKGKGPDHSGTYWFVREISATVLVADSLDIRITLPEEGNPRYLRTNACLGLCRPHESKSDVLSRSVGYS